MFFSLFGYREKLNLQSVDDEQSVPYVSIRPGGRIYVKGDSFSVGYRAFCNMNSQVGFPGIITCAHGFGTSTNNNIYSDANCTNSIGYRLKSQTSGNVDAAFVAINSPNQFINSCYGTGEAIRDGGYMSSPAVGSTVIKTGARTGTTKGVVVSTSATSITSDGTLTDLVKVNTLTGTGIAYNGDSGGIVFFSSSVNTVCGILNCGSPSATASSPSTYYYYVKAININKALNAAPY